VDTFTADGEDRDKADTATLPSSMSGGMYSVECWMQRDGGEWETDTATAGIKVIEVEMDCLGHPSGFDDLDDDKVCTNAQSEYGKTKFEVTKIEPSGNANVSASGVSLTPIGGASLGNLNVGDQFWAVASGSTGVKTITLEHNDDTCGNCQYEEDVTGFEFKFDWTKINSSSGTGGGGTINETEGSVDAKKASEPPAAGIQNAGYVRWKYELKVITEPSGSYSGNVDAKASVTFDTDGEMKITNYAPPVGWKGFAISVNFGIVSVSVTLASGVTPYGSSVTGADTSIKIATQPEAELTDVPHNYLVLFPLTEFRVFRSFHNSS